LWFILRLPAMVFPPDKETGVLQFVAAGSVRHVAFEEARSWELLKSFEKGSADQLYYAASDRTGLDLLASKGKSGARQLLAKDGAQVMLANFADERASVAMNLNCADASPVEVVLVHDRLHRAFIAKRPLLVSEKCGGEHVWPKKKPFIAYRPPVPAVVPRWKAHLVDLSIAVILAPIGWGFYEFVPR
jgi:hypothetical protein